VLELSAMRVRTYGNVAIVTGLATRKDTIDGQARDFQYRYTRVWILTDDSSQCVLMQATTIGPLGGLSK
jgi:ketosteroid isomerase-like protein